MTHERPLVRVWVCSGHSQPAGKTLPQLIARMSEARCGSVTSVWLRARISLRSSGLLSEMRSSRHSPRRRGIQYAAPSRLQLPPLEYWVVRSSRTTTSEIRSPLLSLFWHCGRPQNSSRTGPERRPGNEPSMVLAEIWSSKGSGNADSQRKARGSGWSGQGCLHVCPRNCCCDRAHPASWRASASYRPLRAVWAFAPGHSGVLSEITRPFSAR